MQVHSEESLSPLQCRWIPPSAGAVPETLSPGRLLDFFRQLLPLPELLELPALRSRGFYERLFTPAVTLWYLIFQRLQPEHTLERVICDAHAGGADALVPTLSARLRSFATTSYSDARQRLPLAFLLEAFALQARHLAGLDAPGLRWRGLPVSLLDGSTVRMRPHGDIPEHFPPHRNQSKTPPYWCLMRVVVSLCAFGGAALDCAMAGVATSEQALACQIIARQALGTACLFVGDRNFGIFRIVQVAAAARSHVHLRLTESRARRLRGRPLDLGTHAVRWSPTRYDQLEPGCPADPVAGHLLVAEIRRPGFRVLRIHLFTTLAVGADYPPEELVALYGVRWHIEMGLRHLKTQMHMAQLECKSSEMARKEWIAGLMAYNLVRASMICAALRGGVDPLKLSFSTSRRHLVGWLARWSQNPDDLDGIRRWGKLLETIQRAKLPKRRNPRPPEPRKQRHLRQSFPPLIGSRDEARKKLLECNLEN